MTVARCFNAGLASILSRVSRKATTDLKRRYATFGLSATYNRALKRPATVEQPLRGFSQQRLLVDATAHQVATARQSRADIKPFVR